jgi:hypothetical protein
MKLKIKILLLMVDGLKRKELNLHMDYINMEPIGKK